MNDRAYLNKKDQARGQGDLKHAYDGVHQWTAEVVLMRMGVSDGYVRYHAQVNSADEDSRDNPLWGYRNVKKGIWATTRRHTQLCTVE